MSEERDLVDAYANSNPYSDKSRDLKFLSDEWMSLEKASKLFKHALEDTEGKYNRFDIYSITDTLQEVLDDLDSLEFKPGREYSPVMYVRSKGGEVSDLKTLQKTAKNILSADEVSFSGESLRLWWD